MATTNTASSTTPGITAPPQTIQPTPCSLRSTDAGSRSRLRRTATAYNAITPTKMIAERMIMNQAMYDTLCAESLAREKIENGALQPVRASSAPMDAAAAARALARRIRLIGCPQGLDVRHDLPDVALGQLRAPRRHSVLTPLGNRREDRRLVAAVIPERITQAWPHSAARMVAMTAGAIVPDEQPAAVGQHALVAVIRILDLDERAVGAGLRTDEVRIRWRRGGRRHGRRVRRAGGGGRCDRRGRDR